MVIIVTHTEYLPNFPSTGVGLCCIFALTLTLLGSKCFDYLYFVNEESKEYISVSQDLNPGR